MRFSIHRLLFVVGFSLLCVAPSAFAGTPRLEKKIHQDSASFTLKLEANKPITVGSQFEVKLHIGVRKPWHMYSSRMSADGGLIPLSLHLPDALAPYFRIVSMHETGKTVDKYDSNFMMMTMAHYTPFDIVLKLQALKAAPAGLPFSLYINYQTCNESMCLPPFWYDIPSSLRKEKPIVLKIAASTDSSTSSAMAAASDSAAMVPAVRDSATTASTATSSVARIDTAAGGAMSSTKTPAQKAFSWYYLLIAIGAGLGALVTPCVYPMIPITVSFFTKRNAGSRRQAILDSLLYGLGIVLTFVVLGFLLNLVFSGGIQGFAANPATNISVAIVFLLFALNLFGMFEIGVPSAWLSKLNRTAQTTKNRYTSVILMGFVFSLTSFTCSVPFVGSAFGAFRSGSFVTPLIGMTVFASVFALPFVLLALAPSLMKQMPRSGGWLNSVKVVLGFVEVAIAIRYFSNADLILHWNIFSRDLVIAAWVSISVVTTLYLLGRFRLSHDTPIEHIGALRVLVAVFVLSIGVYLYTGLHGRPLGQIDAFLPPPDDANVAMASVGGASGSLTSSPEELVWHARLNEALAEAKRTGKNVFIDFTGYTCTNCRSMERLVFSRKDVQDIFQQFVLARLYTDDGSPLNDSNRTMEESRFNTIALPYYVILSPDNQLLASFPGFTRDVGAFKSFLHLEKRGGNPAVAMLQ